MGLPASAARRLSAEMLEGLTRQVGPLRHGRPSWEAELPLDEIRCAPFSKLVVSGAHHPAFDAVCDELTQRLGADRAVIAGAGHEVQMTGEPFNDALLSFWRCAPPSRPHRERLTLHDGSSHDPLVRPGAGHGER